MREIGHFIGGKHVAGTSGRSSNVFNPATGEVQATVALATDAELDAPATVVSPIDPASPAGEPAPGTQPIAGAGVRVPRVRIIGPAAQRAACRAQPG